ncbi:transcription factor TFIIIB component B'' homolog [Euwallacea fornicatus]|uniref:transcription factor TFIIIB component B'' homolog n=1 Tax=Euwallacea fornicatus TaxID=995702 RepID=UPI00338E6C3B
MSRRLRIKPAVNINQKRRVTEVLEAPLISEKPVEENFEDGVAADTITSSKLHQVDLDKKDTPNDSSQHTETFTSEPEAPSNEIKELSSVALQSGNKHVEKNPDKQISVFIQRRFLKPSVNPNLLTPRPVAMPPSAETPINSAEDPTNNNIVILNEITIPKPSNKVVRNISKLLSTEAPTQETPLLTHIESSPTVTLPHLEASDIEYSGPPASPSKYNRCRIKAVPRLSLRKPSASESEDEGRSQYGMIRNNSVCSLVSTANTDSQVPISEDSSKEVGTLQKKVFRNEQSKKVAEARREFYRRNVANSPDKQKLKMIDLIYYNPTGTPMSNATSSTTATHNNLPSAEEPLEEPPIEPEEEEEDNTPLPVPQIKIGPSGEIILDEQSLVMENTRLAKQKEQMLNSKVIDADKTTYGVYKRSPRRLSWSQKETVRFYKALNLIGTDFSLMSQLFPKRNRQELKNKFKKEDKSNRQLVDKVLKQPCSYNFDDLKRELEVDLEEEAFLEKLKEEEKLESRKRKLEVKKQKREGTEEQLKKKKRKKPGLNIENVIDDDDSDSNLTLRSDYDFEEEEIIPFLKPTRSGRIPKSTQKFNESLLPIPEVTRKSANLPKSNSVREIHRLCSTSSTDSDTLIPGSVVVTAEQNPQPGYEYKVFMVTPERKLASLELDSAVVDKLIKEGSMVTLPLEEVSEAERNITIVEGGEVSVRQVTEPREEITTETCATEMQ